jgi:hypothetical protein
MAHHALARLRPRVRYGAEIDQVTVFQTSAGQIALIDEYDVTASSDPPITVIHAVDRRIVLIMTSNRRQRERFTIRPPRIFIQAG